MIEYMMHIEDLKKKSEKNLNRFDHISSVLVGAGAGLGGYVATSLATSTNLSGSDVIDGVVVVGAATVVAVVAVSKYAPCELKPYSALTGATMSLAILFGANASDLGSKLDDLQANNKNIQGTELVAKQLHPVV